MSIWNIISCSFYLWVVQQGVLNDFIHFAVDIDLSLHPIKVFCPGEDTSGQRFKLKFLFSGYLEFNVLVFFYFRSEKLAPHTYSVTGVLHLFSVFQVHGPDVAIKQACRVRNSVCSCTAETQSIKSHDSLSILLKCNLSPDCQRVTFSSFCTPHKEGKCRNIRHRCQ